MALRQPRRAGGRTELDIDPDDLSWILYARESEDADGEGEQVKNQMEDLVEEAQAIGGRIGRRVHENDTSAFKKRRVRLHDGTFAYRVVRPKWDSVLTDLRHGKHNALMLPNIDRGTRDPRDLEPLTECGSAGDTAANGSRGVAMTGSGCDVRCVWTRDAAGTGSGAANGMGVASEGAVVLLLVLRMDRAGTRPR